jgi:Spy/CpxP family protein refolding chaperone
MSETLQISSRSFSVLRLSLGAFALAAALTVPFAASAQTAPAPAAPQNAPAAVAPAHHGSAYMRAMRNLNLSAAQKAKIRDIIHSARMARAANPGPVDPQTRRQNTIAMRQQIESVLTDAQRAQLHASLPRHHHHANATGDAGAPQQAPQAPQQ